MSRILTLNAGSSSIKFALFDAGEEPVLALSGQVERIGGEAELRARAADGATLADRALGTVADHDGATAAILAVVADADPDAEVIAVGHRVVHGGPTHAAPAVLTDEVVAELSRLAPFAPLHQPHNLAAIAPARKAFPKAVQVACFDTAFHRTQDRLSDIFALPRRYYDKGVRRYGFHGLSYDYVAGRLAQIAPELHAGRVVVAHLGNGASMCAIRQGRSVASTMGFSALDGLPMGTRTGQIDPGVLLYLMTEEGMDAKAIETLLYKKSGLLGLSGLSNDMRMLEEAGTPEAEEAIAYFTDRIRRATGALVATLGGIDALVFTAGIGEHSVRVRHEVTAGLGWLGIELDAEANAAGREVISTPESRVRAMIVPTDEERVIARAALRLVGSA